MAKKEQYNYAIDYDPERDLNAGNTDGNREEVDVKKSQENNPEVDDEPKPSEFLNFFKDKRTHAVTGIALILVAAYILISAISYFSSSTHDQSALNHTTFNEMVDNQGSITNVGGPAGARLSHWMITEGFGIGALVAVIWLAVVGLRLTGLLKTLKFWSFTLKCLVTAIAVSYIAGFLQLTLQSTSDILFGGYHGRFISIWLIERIDWLGAAGVAILLGIILIFVYLNPLTIFFKALSKTFHKLFSAKVRTFDDDDLDDEEENEEETPDDKSVETELQDVEEPETPQEPEEVNISFADTTVFNEEMRSSASTDFIVPDRHPSAAKETEDKPVLEDPLVADDHNDGFTEVPKSVKEPAVTETSEEFSIDTNKIEEAEDVKNDLYDPTAELSRYTPPSLDLLIQRTNKSTNVDLDEQEENKERITKTLRDYGIEISRIKATVGPTVTLYEIVPAEGVRIAKIKRLEDDIALSLAALGIRIIAPIPGKGTIGIEVPNKDPQTVSIRSILGSKAFQESKYQLPMAMGATIANEVYIADLAKMPHLLVAGATGQGKSVGLNTIIASLLYKKHPAELKFVLIDPKQVEFSLYSRLRNHFMAQLADEDDPVVTKTENVERTLASLCLEMENRYTLLKDANVRSLTEYNEKFAQHRLNPEKGHRFLPYIVIIVDEFADLIMTSGKTIETPIARIAQKARAVGMHMIIATQRPSTNVITGIIKANFPGRVAFRVSQMVDSKTILDRTGANQLIGRGDMLFSHNGNMDRVQCAFIDTPEVDAIVEAIASQPGYLEPYILPEPVMGEGGTMSGETIGDRDPLFIEAGRFICSGGETASTSSLQRRFEIGYNRAGRIIDQLEAAGVVSAARGSKPRNVLMDILQFESMYGA